MHWIRSNIQFGARLALLALSLQLVLSFGHLHLDDLVSPSVASMHEAAAGPATDTSPNPSAPMHKPGGAGDVCAVCALIQLANALVPSSAPALVLPTELRPLRWRAGLDFSSVLSAQSLFRARAPPFA
jgi:hypothetical protein